MFLLSGVGELYRECLHTLARPLARLSWYWAASVPSTRACGVQGINTRLLPFANLQFTKCTQNPNQNRNTIFCNVILCFVLNVHLDHVVGFPLLGPGLGADVGVDLD